MHSSQLQPHPPPPPPLLFLQRGWEASLDLSIISHKLMSCRESSSLSSTHKLLPAPSSALEMPRAGSSRGSFLLGCDEILVPWGTRCHQPRAEPIHWPRMKALPISNRFCIPESSPAVPQHVPWVIAAQREACPACVVAWLQAGMDPAWELFLLVAVGFTAVAQALSGLPRLILGLLSCLLSPQAAVPRDAGGHRTTGRVVCVMPATCGKVADGLLGFRSHPAGTLLAFTFGKPRDNSLQCKPGL